MERQMIEEALRRERSKLKRQKDAVGATEAAIAVFERELAKPAKK